MISGMISESMMIRPLITGLGSFDDMRGTTHTPHLNRKRPPSGLMVGWLILPSGKMWI